jgi:5-methylcytosine-specific restriction endonuclease McrA
MLGPTNCILGEPTLVLNRSWLAITTTTVRRALSLVFQDSAHVICPRTYRVHDFSSWASLEVNGDPFIRTVRSRVRLPEVIVLRAYDGLPMRTVAFSRRNLYRRDAFACQYCGRRPGALDLTIDHVIPRSRGGKTSWENCVLACVECNKRKANRPPDEAGMRLIRVPGAPQWSWDVELGAARRASWESFLPRRNGHHDGHDGHGHHVRHGHGHNGHGHNGHGHHGHA